jgi:hypothetical protein
MDKMTPITQVPFKIDKPDTYVVQTDLYLSSDNATAISADLAPGPITIDLNGHALWAPDEVNTASGIYVRFQDPSSSVIIQNGSINGFNRTIDVYSGSQNIIQQLQVSFQAFGIALTGCTSSKIDKCTVSAGNEIQNPRGYGIYLSGGGNSVVGSSVTGLDLGWTSGSLPVGIWSASSGDQANNFENDSVANCLIGLQVGPNDILQGIRVQKCQKFVVGKISGSFVDNASVLLINSAP